MNREQRRKLNLSPKESAVLTDLINMSKVKKALDNWKPIPEGTKVKLNIERIKADVNYDRLTDQYKTWIKENQDKTFTVEYDAKHKDNPQLLCLKENVEPVQWLFWEGDLIVLEDKE
jgi:hypothetical protein